MTYPNRMYMLCFLIIFLALSGCTSGSQTTYSGAVDGDMTEEDATDGDTADGDVTDGDAADGDVADGDTTDGDTTDGDTTDGDVTDGDTTDGDAADGDVTDGDVADGDITDVEDICPGSAPLNDMQAGVCEDTHQRCDATNGWVNDYSGIADYEATEVSCDGLDNDCDGVEDNGLTGPLHAKQYGVCDGSRQSCNGEYGWVNDYGGIADYEATEVSCDGLDNDCDGGEDNGLTGPLHAKQYGVCDGSRQSCDGSNGWVNDYGGIAGYEETEVSCDGLDNDCDASVDEGCPGKACNQASECISNHCQNAFCCAAGDCCAVANDCPSGYSDDPVCDNNATCQGHRVDAFCVSNECGSENVDDDTGCGMGTEVDSCGYYDSVYCSGAADQTAPDCPTSCSSDGECDDFADCISEACGCPPGFAGEFCDECATGYAGDLCNECAEGYIGYPDCEEGRNWDFEYWPPSGNVSGWDEPTNSDWSAEAETTLVNSGGASARISVETTSSRDMDTFWEYSGVMHDIDFTAHMWFYDNDFARASLGLRIEKSDGTNVCYQYSSYTSDSPDWSETTVTLNCSEDPAMHHMIGRIRSRLENGQTGWRDIYVDDFDITTPFAFNPDDGQVDDSVELNTGPLPVFLGINDEGRLYAATLPAIPGGHDHMLFIWVGGVGETYIDAPWAKSGQVAAAENGVLFALIQEESSGYCEWRVYESGWIGAPPECSVGAVLEGTLDLPSLMALPHQTYVPAHIHYTAISVESHDGGWLFAPSQSPVSLDQNADIDKAEVETGRTHRAGILQGRLE